MFGEKNVKFPVYSEKINKKLSFDKEDGFNWEQLSKKGFVKETITESDDIVVIVKEFSSSDGTLNKKETLSLPVEEWEKMKVGMMSEEEAKREIKKLKDSLEIHKTALEYEMCAVIRDKIQLIEKIAQI